ncbi:hypothetical protein HDE_00229 [Halotydeus destructor]|nr:hypothetical protein HDE_00229 [Halotydeus destructor]
MFFSDLSFLVLFHVLNFVLLLNQVEGFLAVCKSDEDCIPSKSRVCAFNCLLNCTTCFRTRDLRERCLVREQCSKTNAKFDCVFDEKCGARICKCSSSYKLVKGDCLPKELCIESLDCVGHFVNATCIQNICTELPMAQESRDQVTKLPTLDVAVEPSGEQSQQSTVATVATIALIFAAVLLGVAFLIMICRK